MNLNILRRPFVVLLTVPAAIALFIGCLPFLFFILESHLLSASIISFIPDLNFETSQTALTIVAGGAMTALSLTYSLVLVVFTLAAGNIGPRMLERFTSDLVNQITAGIFGGTFLYALISIMLIERSFVPKITVIGSEFLAVLCVMQLIYFVRHVSKTVTIDDEIADITENLKLNLQKRYDRSDANDAEDKDVSDDKFTFEICASKSGYICSVAEEKLLNIATKHEVCLKAHKPMGEYTLSEEVLFSATKELDDELIKSIQHAVSIQPSRSEDSPIEFSINLLLEIALRALSPGTNDTYTAIATVDSLSNALSSVTAREKLSSLVLKDREGAERLILPEFSVEHLINQAFHPLRRAAGENILMSQCIARAYARLFEASRKDVRAHLEEHSLLLLRELEHAGHFDEDIKSVSNKLPSGIRDRYNKQHAED